MQNSVPPVLPHTRLVLFLTQEVAEDIPAGHTRLACLLPFGSASFLERLMDSCTLAGVREMDLVVSDHPEALRATLLDGAPWGIALRWHHVKDAAAPYKALRGLQLKPGQHTVIGHGHQWVNSRVLRELMQSTAVALELEPDVRWTGWFSADAATLAGLGAHADYAAVAMRLRRMDDARCVIATRAECASAESARALLAAQLAALQGSQEAAIPATWLRAPWGAASPDAMVHADARIEGPALIGPGCVVEAGAELEAGVVLARDVYVASGARIRHALVLPNTYVGGQVTLEHALAQGSSVQSLKWNARTVLQSTDALLTQLHPSSVQGTPLLSRLLALIAFVLLLPLLLSGALLQRLQARRVFWRRSPVVKARLQGHEPLDLVTLRLPHDGQRLSRWVGHCGALLDIVQGQRNWFGVRPRSESEWHALGRDWQSLFSHSAIGLITAAAWRENSPSLNHEAEAAADAFLAVQNTAAERARLLYQRAFPKR